MSKAFVLGFVLGLALLLVVGVAASRLRQKDAEQQKRQTELATYQADVADATPVQFGVLTDRQRTHSRLFSHYLELTKNFTVRESAARAKNKSAGIEVHVGLMPALTEPESPENYFREVAHQSAAVIRGRVTGKLSQITEDDGFIFTDYDILVIEVLKNNATAPLNLGTAITVTRPGGKVLIDGTVVKALDHGFSPLPINGHDLLLFLKYVPEIGSYRTTTTGSFELDGSFLRPLTEVQFPPGVIRDADSFLQTMRGLSKR